jgi:hypothetical protein
MRGMGSARAQRPGGAARTEIRGFEEIVVGMKKIRRAACDTDYYLWCFALKTCTKTESAGFADQEFLSMPIWIDKK